MCRTTLYDLPCEVDKETESKLINLLSYELYWKRNKSLVQDQLQQVAHVNANGYYAKHSQRFADISAFGLRAGALGIITAGPTGVLIALALVSTAMGYHLIDSACQWRKTAYTILKDNCNKISYPNGSTLVNGSLKPVIATFKDGTNIRGSYLLGVGETLYTVCSKSGFICKCGKPKTSLQKLLYHLSFQEYSISLELYSIITKDAYFMSSLLQSNYQSNIELMTSQNIKRKFLSYNYIPLNKVHLPKKEKYNRRNLTPQYKRSRCSSLSALSNQNFFSAQTNRVDTNLHFATALNTPVCSHKYNDGDYFYCTVYKKKNRYKKSWNPRRIVTGNTKFFSTRNLIIQILDKSYSRHSLISCHQDIIFNKLRDLGSQQREIHIVIQESVANRIKYINSKNRTMCQDHIPSMINKDLPLINNINYGISDNFPASLKSTEINHKIDNLVKHSSLIQPLRESCSEEKKVFNNLYSVSNTVKSQNFNNISRVISPKNIISDKQIFNNIMLTDNTVSKQLSTLNDFTNSHKYLYSEIFRSHNHRCISNLNFKETGLTRSFEKQTRDFSPLLNIRQTPFSFIPKKRFYHEDSSNSLNNRTILIVDTYDNLETSIKKHNVAVNIMTTKEFSNMKTTNSLHSDQTFSNHNNSAIFDIFLKNENETDNLLSIENLEIFDVAQSQGQEINCKIQTPLDMKYMTNLSEFTNNIDLPNKHERSSVYPCKTINLKNGSEDYDIININDSANTQSLNFNANHEYSHEFDFSYQWNNCSVSSAEVPELTQKSFFVEYDNIKFTQSTQEKSIISTYSWSIDKLWDTNKVKPDILEFQESFVDKLIDVNVDEDNLKSETVEISCTESPPWNSTTIAPLSAKTMEQFLLELKKILFITKNARLLKRRGIYVSNAKPINKQFQLSTTFCYESLNETFLTGILNKPNLMSRDFEFIKFIARYNDNFIKFFSRYTSSKSFTKPGKQIFNSLGDRWFQLYIKPRDTPVKSNTNNSESNYGNSTTLSDLSHTQRNTTTNIKSETTFNIAPCFWTYITKGHTYNQRYRSIDKKNDLVDNIFFSCSMSQVLDTMCANCLQMYSENNKPSSNFISNSKKTRKQIIWTYIFLQKKLNTLRIKTYNRQKSLWSVIQSAAQSLVCIELLETNNTPLQLVISDPYATCPTELSSSQITRNSTYIFCYTDSLITRLNGIPNGILISNSGSNTFYIQFYAYGKDNKLEMFSCMECKLESCQCVSIPNINKPLMVICNEIKGLLSSVPPGSRSFLAEHGWRYDLNESAQDISKRKNQITKTFLQYDLL